jgi:hypothetical protein
MKYENLMRWGVSKSAGGGRMGGLVSKESRMEGRERRKELGQEGGERWA